MTLIPEAARKHVPEPPLLVAGALGGPFVIVSLTPFRNAMSNGAQDQTSGLREVYRRAFGGATSGFGRRVRVAFAGGAASVLPACPQWCVIGPAFHFMHGFVPAPIALLGTATLEAFITFGSQSRNAQLSLNAQNIRNAVPLFAVWRSWGPGAGFFVARNFCGMSGIRIISPALHEFLAPLPVARPAREAASDFLASMMTCLVSAPLNLCWTYTVTTPRLWSMTTSERSRELLLFLRRQYVEPGGTSHRVSPLALRDLTLRCVYIACCFSMFSGIERLAVASWP